MFFTISDKEKLFEGSLERDTPTIWGTKTEVTVDFPPEAIQVRRQGATLEKWIKNRKTVNLDFYIQ